MADVPFCPNILNYHKLVSWQAFAFVVYTFVGNKTIN